MIEQAAELDIIALAGAKARGKRPYFFKDPDVERVLSITMALAGELAVTRQRLDTIERLLAERNILNEEQIEAFKPSPQQAEERGRWNQEFLARILRIIQQEIEATASTDEPTSEAVGDQLAQED